MIYFFVFMKHVLAHCTMPFSQRMAMQEFFRPHDLSMEIARSFNEMGKKYWKTIHDEWAVDEKISSGYYPPTWEFHGISILKNITWKSIDVIIWSKIIWATQKMIHIVVFWRCIANGKSCLQWMFHHWFEMMRFCRTMGSWLGKTTFFSVNCSKHNHGMRVFVIAVTSF